LLLFSGYPILDLSVTEAMEWILILIRREPIASGIAVCTENLIRVDDVMESPKLAE
jgi:hypothetical protein